MSNHWMCESINFLTYSQWVYMYLLSDKCVLLQGFTAQLSFKTFALEQKCTKADLEMCFRLMPDLVCCVQIYSGTMRRTIVPPGARRRRSSVRRRVEGGGGRPMRRRRRRVEEHIYSFLACLLPLSLLIPLLDSIPSAQLWHFLSHPAFISLP